MILLIFQKITLYSTKNGSIVQLNRDNPRSDYMLCLKSENSAKNLNSIKKFHDFHVSVIFMIFSHKMCPL